MARIASICLTLLVVAGAAPAVAQNQAPARGEIVGRVIEAEAGEPVAGASIAVWSPADSSIVTGAVAREDGAFVVEAVPPGDYYVRIQSIGYAAYRSEPFTIGPEAPRRELGTVRLSPAAVESDAIAVTVERETVTLAPDRNAYLARDVAPAATSASEVLENVPSVQVDTEGRVSLRGSENVAVQIDGRPAPVRGDQLADYLRQLPAQAIERVEVIPTPSAAEDPEGMAGIVNIVMKKDTELGASGGFSVSAATSDRYTVNGNAGYQRGPFTLFSTYGYHRSDRDYLGLNDRQRLAPGAAVAFTEQDLDGVDERSGHNLSTTLDVRLGEKDVITNALVLNRRSADEETFSAYTELDAAREVVDRFARPRDGDDESALVDYTLAHTRTWEPRAHELASEIRFHRSRDEETTRLWRQPVDAPTERTELEDNEVDALDRELVAQVDYTRALRGRTKLETGYKGTVRWIDRDYVVLEDALGTGTWTRDEGRSNAFEFDERVHAVYGVVSHTAGRLDLQAGLRAEVATQDFALADESFPHDYTSLFPSAIAVFNASETTRLKAAWSRRIRRPNTFELNPFPMFMDTQNVFFGNPELDPEYTDAFELGYTRATGFGSLQVSPFYRHTSDVIRWLVDTDDVVDGREVTSIRFDNLATSDSWGADVNATFEVGERFDGFASFNLFKMVTEGRAETSLASDAVNWTARVNGSARLTPTVTLQGMLFYRAPMEHETATFSSFTMAGFTLQKKISQAASLTLRVTDPFDTMEFRVRADDANIVQITEREFDARGAQLTFRYDFGRAPKVRRPRTDTGDEGGGIFPQ